MLAIALSFIELNMAGRPLAELLLNEDEIAQSWAWTRRRIDDREIEDIITRTLESKPIVPFIEVPER
ncbi:hypothetical protein [Reinekea sp. G2M2-21]|uniref:hypothetical protein n=1 Tax=Reinekea sp. G2M2-21 TaxID=2788942 RepID=UPI001E3DC1AC|nr:hypothetical protein [Reinekea sp. G2M2-21]